MQQAQLTAEDVLSNALGLRLHRLIKPELEPQLNDLINKFPRDMLQNVVPYSSPDNIDSIFSKGDYAALVYLN